MREMRPRLRPAVPIRQPRSIHNFRAWCRRSRGVIIPRVDVALLLRVRGLLC